MWLFRFPLVPNTGTAPPAVRRRLLRRRLAGAAGDRHHRAPEAPPHVRASACSAAVVSRLRSTTRPAAARRCTRDRWRRAPARARLRERRGARTRGRRTARPGSRRTASPGASVRVSIDTADRNGPGRRDTTARGGGGHGPAVSERAGGHPLRHPRSRRAARAQRRARHLHVVERAARVADDLVLLVALAGDEDEVARLRVAIARSIAAARSTIVATARCAARLAFRAPGSAGTMPRLISSMIARGILGPRVVGGHDRPGRSAAPPRRPSAAAWCGRGRRRSRTR
jgi:hypothetical protein